MNADNNTSVIEKDIVSDDALLYKLWLNITCGHSPLLVDKCIKACGSAQDIFLSDEIYKKFVKILPLGSRLKVRRSLDEASALAEMCADKGIEIISIDDRRYPKRLAEVYMPPQILYVLGEMPDIDNLVCITVVGSRNCTDYGRRFANELAYDMAKAGILIIGGMAEGIDTSAHIGAMEAGNKTLAVLAGGPDVIYPKSGTDVYNQIISHGAVISERPPGTVGRGNFYKERNRIMVGLSMGTVIIEGQERSGTKLTANWTIDSNRDLFAVPGKPGDKLSALPNELIKDSAKLITSAEDIICEYTSVYVEELSAGKGMIGQPPEILLKQRNITETKSDGVKQKSVTEKLKPVKRDFSNYDENQRKVLEYLYDNQGAHTDDISRDLNMDMANLSFVLIGLEMLKEIERRAGDHYYLI